MKTANHTIIEKQRRGGAVASSHIASSKITVRKHFIGQERWCHKC